MSEAEVFFNGRIALHCGDCLEVMATMPDNSVDSFVSDPPYHLTSIVKRFGNADSAAAKDYTGEKQGATGAYARASRGFMGKQWDGGDIAFRVELWREVLRILKPGGHLLAFSGTRTYHRMAYAIDEAGFEVRDMVSYLYGSGFPKSHDVAKRIDKQGGVWRGKVARALPSKSVAKGIEYERVPKGSAVSDLAREWEGWGTALKPACEPIVLARKPLSESTVAANVLRWGTGALNIDGCRVEHYEPIKTMKAQGSVDSIIAQSGRYEETTELKANGRWPANVIHDGSAEVVGAFPDSGPAKSGGVAGWQKDGYVGGKYEPIDRTGYDDEGGSAARFFYTAKADADDRLGSKHPTVKPLDLMQYLVRLVTPPRGVILDCFAGTGTTGEAAWREGFSAVLIEREEEYQSDIRRRMALALAGPDERQRESIKARGLVADAGPLFGGSEAVAGGADRFTESMRTRTADERPDNRSNRTQALKGDVA